jgi:hypothetical protein
MIRAFLIALLALCLTAPAIAPATDLPQVPAAQMPADCHSGMVDDAGDTPDGGQQNRHAGGHHCIGCVITPLPPAAAERGPLPAAPCMVPGMVRSLVTLDLRPALPPPRT